MGPNEQSKKTAEIVNFRFYCYFRLIKKLRKFNSQRVLTTEFIDGIKISDTAALQKAGISLADVSHKLVEAFAEQIFHTGFVHVDPHPGNS